MPPLITNGPEWMDLALYAVGVALVLILLFRVPYVGRLLRAVLSFGLLAFFLFMLFQQAQFDPTLSRLADRLGMSRQEVVGEEIHIPLAPDGHFWVEASINGVERRMLVDTGATLTALTEATAEAAGIDRGASLVPVAVRTANGVVRAQTGMVEVLRLGDLEVRNVRVMVSPAFAGIEVLGMNVLSEVEAWRVEDRTLILTP